MKNLIPFLSVLFLISCAPKSSNDENTLAKISNPEVMQYAIAGKTLYENHCANCHQSNGKGLGKLIPPLKNSDYFKADIHRAIWIMKYGQKGEITVNGQIYNQEMPASPRLTPLELAQITTYLLNIWGLEEGKITSSEVEKFLKTKPSL